MRYLIASDIHGSAYYTRKLVEAFEKEGADRMILLGDILYHGPRNDLPEEYDPKQVAALLNKYKDVIYCVKGNCEADVDQMMLEFPINAAFFLMESGSNLLFFTHGDKFNPDNLPPLKKRDAIIFGHTHVQTVDVKDGIFCINPGSVSIPKGNSYNGYIVMENGVFTYKDFQGEMHHTLIVD
ncbi:MAG: phosphodiesterase [Erysipelotrichaceae bacterium]|nr:phosphodiesterase [Erysipelotrichaceae bacterium]